MNTDDRSHRDVSCSGTDGGRRSDSSGGGDSSVVRDSSDGSGSHITSNGVGSETSRFVVGRSCSGSDRSSSQAADVS